ncbi:sensor histidine kinase [Halobaculum lipolyticum]|uniref:histidine kinase n=1 Tax=Halobaculum lipolyticum TaxID=3032001 RepID=A0ABD5WGI4_9EURY|nr:ATP-binding protein [Halobaculum sp. DT31]
MSAEDDSIAVLYVNDEPELLDLLATGLERNAERITVSTAESVAEGLAHRREHAVDCIVSDYSMPEATGIDFLETVREHDPELPFVMFAETGSERVASEAISAGVTDYVIEQAIGNQHELLARKIATYVDRRRAERRAERTNRRLRELADVSDDVLWMFSADWSELLFINGAHELLFGQPVDELYADPDSFLERVHPDDTPRVRAAMARAAGGDSQSVEYRVRQSASVEVWVESHCEPVVEDGEVLRMTGFTRDITDRKVHERELATTNEQLEQFTSTVAHDLRNPIAIADGHLELAREAFDSPHLDASARAVERMDELIDDLLTLARTGTAVGDAEPVEFAEVIRAAEHNVATADATLTVDRTCRIECDATRLKEAVENLLRNAVEHNEAAVAISAGILPDGGGFYVEDDGEGIRPANRDDVFDDGYTTVQKGTGFGLSIVSRIVDAHGWAIEVTGGPDGGARFEVTSVDCCDTPRAPATAGD